LEENGGLHNIQRALGHATILNAVRNMVILYLPLFPPMHCNLIIRMIMAGDQGANIFTPTRVWGMPPFMRNKWQQRITCRGVCKTAQPVRSM
jgi:hypothetical protein